MPSLINLPRLLNWLGWPSSWAELSSPPRRFSATACAHGNGGPVTPRYRSDIGRGILLGLELLVGADIISTITAPLTFESVGLLAAIVAIRTFLSFSLETEIEGCWPWQRSSQKGHGGTNGQTR